MDGLVTRGLTAALAFTLAACGGGTPDERFVADAAEALGGRDRVAAVTTMIVEGEGRIANLGQDMTWEATAQGFELTDYHRVVDLAGGAARTDQTRTPDFLYYQGPTPQSQTLGIVGDIAYSVGANGTASRNPDATARERRAEVYQHPLTVVRAMLQPSAQVVNVRQEGAGRVADVTIAGVTLEVHLDDSGLVSSIRSDGTHPNLGDVTVTNAFGDYEEFDGLRLPVQITTQLDGRAVTELRVREYTINADISEWPAPSAVVSAPAPAPSAPNVEAIEVADGVWLLAGQSHHSALVEFADHLMLIEAPHSEARTLAVMAKARALVPGKPLTQVVVSHHHFDHTAGLRAAIAEGLTVITHGANAAFVEEIAERAHTREPDTLEKSQRPVSIQPVTDMLTLTDATMTVELYPLTGNPHSDTLLMAYLPRARILIQADAFSPGGTYHPYAANLLQHIRKRKLRVERIVPLHGSVVSLADLEKAVNAQQH